MDIHQKLRNMMQQRGWSEYRLAKECGLSESTLANIFRRNTMPSVTTLETICKAFNITLSQFFAENDFIEMTPEIAELIDHWNYLTPKQKELVMALIKAFSE